jgi:hypothetical protein
MRIGSSCSSTTGAGGGRGVDRAGELRLGAGEGEGDREPFLRLRRRDERSDSGVEMRGGMVGLGVVVSTVGADDQGENGGVLLCGIYLDGRFF